mmetsp:Transcript_31108/g.96266  ORF Transcript_31108/g.96266 Transcript_31108/m.96266 type:complete len:146 (+) Transcript_31108:691-1128(+)
MPRPPRGCSAEARRGRPRADVLRRRDADAGDRSATSASEWPFPNRCVDKTNERAGNCLTCTEGYKLVPLPGMGFNKGKCYGYCVNAKDKYHPHDGFDKTQWDYVAIGSDSEGLTLRVKTKEGKIQKNSKMWAKAYPGELTCDYSE